MFVLRKYIKRVLSEIKTSEYEELIDRSEMVSSHPIYSGRYQGREHFVKFPSNEIQTLNEFLAYRIYSLYDVKIPDSYHIVFNDKGRLGISTETFEGGIYKGRRAQPKLRDSFNVNVGSMYYVDAMMANWDAAKNVLVNFDKFNNQGELDYRMIDPGGALDFRARGERKGHLFGDEVGELETYLDPKMTRGTGASYVYGGRDDQLAQQKFLAVSWSEIEEMINITQEEVNKELSEHRRQELISEFTNMCNDAKLKLKNRYQYIIDNLQ